MISGTEDGKPKSASPLEMDWCVKPYALKQYKNVSMSEYPFNPCCSNVLLHEVVQSLTKLTIFAYNNQNRDGRFKWLRGVLMVEGLGRASDLPSSTPSSFLPLIYKPCTCIWSDLAWSKVHWDNQGFWITTHSFYRLNQCWCSVFYTMVKLFSKIKLPALAVH